MPKFTVRQTFTIVRTCEVEAETEIDATDFIANSCVENHCAEHEWPVPPYLESSGYAKTITRMDEEYYEALLWVWYQQRKDDKATDRDATKPASTVRLIQRPKLYDWRSEKWL